MNELTVIIPFLNEGKEIENTVATIRSSAGYEVDILLINDASYDGYDYESVAYKYKTDYLYNTTRKGVAASRDIGVDTIKTDYFLIVDGHMRFYDNDWWKIIVAALKKDERVIYCCKCNVLRVGGIEVPDKNNFGAYLELINTVKLSILTPVWNHKDMFPDEDEITIPCILGASYAASKKYWKYLFGLSGLQMYGSDEAYISLKTWLEGGRCVLIKNLEIGHIFRKTFPYEVLNSVAIYNKLLIIETLVPADLRDGFYNILRKNSGIYLRDAMVMLSEHMTEILNLRKYYDKIFTKSFGSFILLNEPFETLEKSGVICKIK